MAENTNYYKKADNENNYKKADEEKSDQGAITIEALKSELEAMKEQYEKIIARYESRIAKLENKEFERRLSKVEKRIKELTRDGQSTQSSSRGIGSAVLRPATSTRVAKKTSNAGQRSTYGIEKGSFRVPWSGFTYDGWVYYANGEMGDFLYRMSADGRYRQQLTDYSVTAEILWSVEDGTLHFYDKRMNSRTLKL